MIIFSLVLSKALLLVSSPQVPRLQAMSTNMKSALLNNDIIEQYLAKKVSLRGVTSPFTFSPLASLLHTNHFGVIPKHGRPGKWRLIIDSSFPLGGSVNDSINGNDFPLSYSRVDDAIDFIMQEGHGTLLAKVNIRDAYRLSSIHPHNRHLLGMSWDNQLYTDLALPFNLRSGPFIIIQSVCRSLALDTAFLISYTTRTWMII